MLERRCLRSLGWYGLFQRNIFEFGAIKRVGLVDMDYLIQGPDDDLYFSEVDITGSSKAEIAGSDFAEARIVSKPG